MSGGHDGTVQHPEPHDHDHDHDERSLRTAVRRLSLPHGHDAADSIDDALSATDLGLRTVWRSFAALLVTGLAQVAIVAFSGSVALLSDTIHNFSNALTAIPLGFAFWLGRRPPTKHRTYGYGRAEDLAGLVILLLIALSAAVAMWEAIQRLRDPQDLRNVGWVAAAGLVGFLGNEAVALYRLRVGRRIGSAALIADGYHARTDGFTSLAVLAAAMGSMIGWERADPIVGLLISVAIVLVLAQATRHMWPRLMDGVDPELVTIIGDVAVRIEGVEEVEAVRARWIGHELFAEVEIRSSGDLSLAEAHDICEEVRHRLLHDVRGLKDVTLHVSPHSRATPDPHSATAHHFAPPPPEPRSSLSAEPSGS